MNVFISRLDEARRRWYLALESQRLGHGGDRLRADFTACDPLAGALGALIHWLAIGDKHGFLGRRRPVPRVRPPAPFTPGAYRARP